MAKIVKGSHLTVITNPKGDTELVWDWDALAKDVAEAISSHTKEKSKPKKPSTKKKKELTEKQK